VAKMAKTKNKDEVCITIDNMKYCYTPNDRPMFEKPKDPTGSDDKVKRIKPRDINTSVF
jgi:hypothetical protein